MNQSFAAFIATSEAAMSAQFSTEVTRPWGRLYYNLENPDHHDGNKARLIRSTDPDRVVAEVTAFYREKGLTPRALVDTLAEPADLAGRFAAHGYTLNDDPVPALLWEGAPPPPAPLPAGAAIELATALDADAIGLIRREAWGYAGGWMTAMARRELASSRYRFLIARVEGEPAACAAVIDYGSPLRLEYVGTRPAFQGRGLALAMVRQAQRMAGGPLYLLYTNENAGRLYRRAGFREAGELREAECWLEV